MLELDALCPPLLHKKKAGFKGRSGGLSSNRAGLLQPGPPRIFAALAAVQITCTAGEAGAAGAASLTVLLAIVLSKMLKATRPTPGGALMFRFDLLFAWDWLVGDRALSRDWLIGLSLSAAGQRWSGRDLLSGGPPCQSCARQGGGGGGIDLSPWITFGLVPLFFIVRRVLLTPRAGRRFFLQNGL